MTIRLFVRVFVNYSHVKATSTYVERQRMEERRSTALSNCTARVLRRLMPAVPLIMFSAYCDAFTEKEARSAGVSLFVSKSEHMSVLVDKARSLLDHIAA
jgi:DNA-binding NarL/FixJ family response regulator